MHMDSYVLAGILGFSVLFAGVDVVTKSLKDEYKIAKQLSVHAYQTDISHGISMAGPFLSKIRVTPNATRMLTATADLNTQSEKYCVSLPPQEETYCNMSRVAGMYLGDIHSSWSVLGTQSTYTLVKHIFCILLTFSLFWMVEHLIYTEDNYFRKNHKQVRVVVLILAIIIFVGNVIFDIQEDMYKVDAVAIGSITTGISFCLVCLLVICFTHLHEPDSADSASAAAADAAGGGAASALEGASETDPLTGKTGAGFFHFSLWAGQTQTVRRTDEDRYRRLEDMYLNIHVSYLILLLMPLFVILALTSTHQLVVDVHVQLIFFSSVFFALLDIFQTRVMSVLASLTQSGHMSVRTPVGMVKFFVVLAFVLCKLLVLVPAWQLLFKYYTPDGSVSYFLVVWQIVLFAVASAVDLLYVSDFFDSALSEGAKVLPDARSPEKSHVMYKQLSLGFYLIASSVTVLYV